MMKEVAYKGKAVALLQRNPSMPKAWVAFLDSDGLMNSAIKEFQYSYQAFEAIAEYVGTDDLTELEEE